MRPARSGAVAAICVLAVTASLLAAGPVPAEAQPATPGGSFACRASAVNLLGIEPVVANPGNQPCLPDARTLLDLPLESLALRAVWARTEGAAGGGVTARSHAVGVDLALVGLRAQLVEAHATVACEDGQPRLSGGSTLVGLTVNGQPVPSTGPVDLPLAGVGTLHLNHTAVVGSALVQRALWLETSLGSVVLGEARAGFAGSPCASVTIVKVSEPRSPVDFPFTGGLGDFTLRDDAGSPGAERRTFGVPAGGYLVTELRPAGGGGADAGWAVRDVSCADPDGGTAVDVRGGTVQVDLDPGEHVVCTFVNRNAGLLAQTDIDNPAAGRDPAAGAGRLRNPAAGVRVGNPAGGAGGAGPPPPPGPDVRSRADIALPPPPPIPPFEPRPPADDGGSGVLAGAGLVAVPLVVVLGGLLWFLLAGARRRREEETA